MFVTEDASRFKTEYDLSTVSQFQAPMQASTDLSVYLSSLAGNASSGKIRHRRPPPYSPGVPLHFFKEAFVNPVPQVPSFDSFSSESVTPQSEKPLQEVIQGLEAGGTINFKPGVYEGNLTINKDIILRSEGEVVFREGVQITDGRVIMENISFTKGSLTVVGGFAYIHKAKFSTTFTVKGNAIACTRNCSFKSSDASCVVLDEQASLTMVECQVTDRGLSIRNGNFAFIKGSVTAIIKNGIEITGGNLHFESSKIGDCTGNCVLCSGSCNVAFTNCNVYDSENGNLVDAKNGAIVKIKGGDYSGRSKLIFHVSYGASISAEDLNFKKPVITTHQSLLRLKRCRPISVFVADSRLIMDECEIVAAPKSGIVAISNSYLSITNSIFKQCTANGIELAPESAGTFRNCHFNNNQNAGAYIQSTSAIFNECVFNSNSHVGCQITTETAHPVFHNCLFADNLLYGVSILPGTEPEFNKCTFRQNEKCGCIVIKAMPKFIDSEFVNNISIGLEINSGATPLLEQCKFSDNISYGCQISGLNTCAIMNECNFSKHANTSAVLVYSQASACFNRCIFTNNFNYHIETREESKCRIEKSVLYESNGGIGTYVHTEGVLEIDSSSLKDEQKTAVYIGIRGQALINGCEITGCHVAGIIMDTQSNAAIMNNTIKSNGNAGIQIEGGEAKIQNNTIEGHSDFGIYATSLGHVTQEGNSFSDNGKGETQIG